MARASGKAKVPDRQGDRLISLFLDMLAAERGARPNTLAAYRADLEDFAAFTPATGIAQAGSDDIRSYLGDLSRRGLQASSVARKLSAIRQLYRFLYAERHRGDDPAAILEGPRRGRPLPKVLSIADVDRLIVTAARRCAERGRCRKSARGAALLPARTALRDRLARIRTRGAARLGRRGAISAC